MMKVLMANKFFFMKGGSERVFFQERDFLISQGHDVIDFSTQDHRNFPSKYGAYFVPKIDFYGNGSVASKVKQGVSFVHSKIAVRRLRELVIHTQPDIAHLHNIYHQLTPSIINVFIKHGIRVVLTLHDYKLICPSYLALRGDQICTDCHGRRFFKPVLTHCQGSMGREILLTVEAFWHKWRKNYERIDRFLAPSQFIADLSSVRVPSEKLTLLRNGIDISIFRPHFGDDGYALYIGRLSKEKGIPTLLAAQERVASSLPLKVIGTGPLENELRQTFPQAVFLGYRSGQELNDLIAKAAFVVVPSEWYENCSMVVLEAMAHGKPIIGSRIGGITEQIDENHSGLLFEAGNIDDLAVKLMTLQSDQSLRIRMGKAARKKLESEYSLEKHCNSLLKIYDQALSN